MAAVVSLFAIVAIAGGGNELPVDPDEPILPINPVNPVRPDERRSMYADLNGQWDDGLGNVYNISISGNGAFSGSGRSGYGDNLQISGVLNGTAGEFTLTAPAAGLMFAGRLQWDRGCHISFQTYDMNGSPAGQGQMHVNHAPGAPCPS